MSEPTAREPLTGGPIGGPTAAGPDGAAGARLGLTASQTVGPYLAIGLTWEDGSDVVPPGTPGAIVIEGVLTDGAGEPVPDGMVETWQADPAGRFCHPDDPRGAVRCDVPGFRGFGRCNTDAEGRWRIVTLKPGPLPLPLPPAAGEPAGDQAAGEPAGDHASAEAPHLDVSVFARGLLDRVVTRIYFPEDAAVAGPGGHATDPVLQAVPEQRRSTLVATAVDGGYRFDIRLQGDDETVFFDV